MALEQPSSGSVSLMGRDLHRMPADELRRARRDFQMVFQDPYGSLDPRQTVARIVAEPLTAIGHVERAEQRARVAAVLKQVGLRDADMDKFPHEFSGGQRQRIAIARALITQPKLIVADEPVSALDVSVQAQVLNLLEDLQDEFGLSYVLISHDLAVVEYLCDEIAVIYLGRIVEQGTPEDLLNHCAHPYTRALLEAVPRARPNRQRRRGTQVIASQSVGATGCAYAGRCPFADAHCTAVAPVARRVGPGHSAACHHAETIMALSPLAGEA
jgi:peptide/nickel transport system ATP-binding protein